MIVVLAEKSSVAPRSNILGATPLGLSCQPVQRWQSRPKATCQAVAYSCQSDSVPSSIFL